MPLLTTRLRFLDLRAFFIVGALISLCVSDNIGPRLLPLPVAPESSTATAQGSQDDAASCLTASGASACFRVPIIAQVHKRGSLQPQPPPPVTHAPTCSFAQPGDVRTSSHNPHAPLRITSAPVLRPSGRAPPALV